MKTSLYSIEDEGQSNILPTFFCISIPMQMMLQVKESVTFKALANELAQVAIKLSNCMAVQSSRAST
jgi:hypothetical protein